MDILDWLTSNTPYTPVLVEHGFDHSKIVKVKGYIPKHKRYPSNVLQDVTTLSGVYIFFDERGEVAYVGKASNVRQRVLSHLQGHSNTKHVKTNFHKVAFIRCIEFEGRQIEKELIKEFIPYCNVSGMV